MGGGDMTTRNHRNLILSGAIILAVVVGVSAATAQELEKLEKPVPTVPQIFTLTGQFVRMAYNNEGWVTLGYRVANTTQGQEWMLLEMGVTVRKGVKNYVLKREHITLKTPDGSTIQLASQEAFGKADLRSLDRRATQVRDSINYFPVGVNEPCTLSFFSDAVNPARGLSYDQVEISWQRACVGRIYFQIPDGIKIGQHWLHVQFADSEVQVPFRILTKEEEKEFRKKWKTLKKEHEAEYKE
jgi:hypothetical protein